MSLASNEFVMICNALSDYVQQPRLVCIDLERTLYVGNEIMQGVLLAFAQLYIVHRAGQKFENITAQRPIFAIKG